MEKLKEFETTINGLGNSYLEKLKDDNYSIKSKNLTVFGPRTDKWGKVFLKSNRLELVIDLPNFQYTEESISDRLGLKKIIANSRQTGFRTNQQEDRVQLYINIYKEDYPNISLVDKKIVEFLRENSKLVCR